MSDRPPVGPYRLYMIHESAKGGDCTDFPPEVVEELCETAIYWQEEVIERRRAIADLEYEPKKRDYVAGALRSVRSTIKTIKDMVPPY